MKIIKILRIADTRQYEEGPNDRWYPIPGSGITNQCFRCGRDHEVHAEVLLEDGTVAIVGTGCARADELEIKSRLKSSVNTAKTLARNLAKLAAGRAKKASWAQARTVVEALPFPPIVDEGPAPKSDPSWRGERHTFRMGDAVVWVWFPPGFDAERRNCLIESWRTERMREIGFEFYMHSPFSSDVEEALLRGIDRAQARLAELAG